MFMKKNPEDEGNLNSETEQATGEITEDISGDLPEISPEVSCENSSEETAEVAAEEETEETVEEAAEETPEEPEDDTAAENAGKKSGKKSGKKAKKATKETPEETGRADLWKIWAHRTLVFCLCFVYSEVVLHLFLFKSIGGRIFFPILFAMMIAGVFAFIASLMPKIPRRVFTIVIVAVVTIFSEVQLVYHSIFGNLMPMNLTKMGGTAMGNFKNQTFYAIGKAIVPIIVLLVPLIFVIVLAVVLRKKGKTRLRWYHKLTTLAVPVFFALLFFGLVFAGRNAHNSMWKIFNDPNTSTDKSYKNVGMLATTIQETRYMVFGDGGAGSVLTILNDEDEGNYTSENYNMIDSIDFDELAKELDENEELTEDQKKELKELDEYISKSKPTKKNEYTGVLEGYNVVTLCAESFSPLIISEELTPTLYKMTHHGFVFNNYFGTYLSVTTNGEYTMNLGLYPDMSRTKANSSFDVSIGHYLPFCLGAALRREGYVTYAYHNYLGSFYNRYLTHPNMGYDFKSVGDGLNMEISWPASDREMIEVSMDDYVTGDKPFHAYYMTFSGHYHYDWGNPMSKLHRAEVEDLPYSDTVKAYIACNLEIEYALRALEERLEKEGKADKTLIVLTNDHYPYGLDNTNNKFYDELAGREMDNTFEIFRNCFICYVPGFEVNVDEYCSTADILPTVLNLLGVDYDSRMLAGVDILSDTDHIAVLSDKSFITKDFRYDAETDNAYLDEDAEIDEKQMNELLEKYVQIVDNRFNMSKRILYSDYYAHVFGSEIPENPGSEDPGNQKPQVVFEDIDDIFGQAAATFMCTHGYVDPVDEKTFGCDPEACFGEVLDIIYRFAGSPAPTVELPYWYYCGEDFGPESKWYNAVCWASEVGLINYWDTLVTPDEPVNVHLLLRVIYRSAALFGVENPIPYEEIYMIDEAQWKNPYLDRELLEAIHFLFYSRVFTGTTGSIEEVWSAYNEVPTRLRMTNVMFKFYNYHLSKVMDDSEIDEAEAAGEWVGGTDTYTGGDGTVYGN